MKAYKTFAIALVSMLLLGGCASVSTPFNRATPNYQNLPVESLQSVARDLEAAVRAGNREPNLENAHGIVVDTPEIKQAFRSRAARIEILDTFLNTGFGYERSNGLVHIIRSADYKRAVTRRERDRDALLVMGENNNRWTIYEGIMNANNYPRSSLSAIQDIFYKARVEQLRSGMQYEDASGNIAIK